ncbi:MAG: ATP-binding cassette domain-containing protein, partial [Candidatus Hodarchaeota archaeon]
GPEAGPDGGQLIFDGSPTDLMHVKDSLTATGLKTEESIYPHSEMVANGKKPTNIRVKNATAHNLKNVTIEFPKASFTVVTGVSGSGKSSLISNVLKSEAERRFLETLSLYERQGMKEGPEAPVEAVSGLGVTISLDPSRIGGRWYNYRSTVGIITEISHHLALLLSNFGEYTCQQCGTLCQRKNQEWICPSCNTSTHIPEARYFSPSNYASACTTCHGVGSIQTPKPEKLIIHPSKPLCKGAMYSPGFFPKGYLCKPYNGGYYVVQALAEQYNFDPFVTPWDQMSNEAQQAFLFGDPQPLQVTFESRNRPPTTRTIQFGGFYGWIRDWDVGGTYSQTQVCATCQGTRFRPEYLAVTIGGFNIHELSEMPFKNLLNALENISFSFIEYHIAYYSLQTLLTRLRFLIQVGLGYLHCTRVVMTLSAGEAQRIRLAGLLGSQMTSLTLLIDEPTRGLHPSEVDGLLEALTSLRDEKNTIIVVEHDPQVIRAADYVIDIGPGPGVAGGQIIAQGTPNQVAMTDTTTALWLRGERRFTHRKSYRMPKGWVKIYGACENNLRGDLVELPLGVLIGLCGVSGSGKSTLLIDTLGRVLAPKKHTTSVANEPLEPGKYNTILGAEVLQKTMVIDQSQSQISSPLNYFELKKPLFSLYATSEDFIALDMDEKLLSKRCAACRGRGQVKIAMGFLPDVYTICETCQGTGLIPEAQYVRLYEYTLPELFNLTLDQIYELFSNEDKIARPLQAAKDVGLGYLILKQPGITLSGGECQRMKIAKELYKNKSPKTKTNALYILDEPTVGQHMEDIARLIGMLNRLVDEGHTVVVIEHHPNVLAACDWLIELGPEGGLEGGRVIAAGTPDEVAKGTTPTAPYLRAVLEEA